MTARSVMRRARLVYFMVGLSLWPYADAEAEENAVLAPEENAVLAPEEIESNSRSNMYSGYCLNGGFTRICDHSYFCDCREPYYGQRCEKEEIKHHICLNGGQLETSGNMFYCYCADNYFGRRCETKCPSTFQLLDNGDYNVGCYKVLLSAKTWYDAPDSCKRFDRRARLAVLDTADKNNAVKAHLRTYPSNGLMNCRQNPNDPTTNAFWTAGARKIHMDCSSPFYWKPSGAPSTRLTYNNFAAGQPDCSKAGGRGKEPNESCLSLYGKLNYAWNDLSCDYEICSVCEIPPSA